MNTLKAKISSKWLGADPALRAFLIGVFLFGIGNGILTSSFNNYLNDTWGLSASERGFLELPRELPGFILILLYFLFIVDNLMFATRIARTTYLNKIAVEKRDIPATLSIGITMDHAESMSVPLLGGLLWTAYDYS